MPNYTKNSFSKYMKSLRSAYPVRIQSKLTNKLIFRTIKIRQTDQQEIQYRLMIVVYLEMNLSVFSQ